MLGSFTRSAAGIWDASRPILCRSLHTSRTTLILSNLSPLLRLRPTPSARAPRNPPPWHLRIATFTRTPLARATWRDTRRRPPPPSLSSRLSASGGRSFLQRVGDALDRLPPNTIVYAILGANVAVFFLWQYAQSEYRHGRPSWLQWMLENFTSSSANYAAGRVWTLLTSAFSQSEPAHMLLNALSFYWMAPGVLRLLGGAQFTLLYVGGALACSVVSLALDGGRPSMGASGAIYAIVTTFACAFPRTTFLIYAIIPCPAWLAVGGMVAWDGYNAWRQQSQQGSVFKGSRTDYLGHLGGAVAGAAYFLIRVRGRF